MAGWAVARLLRDLRDGKVVFALEASSDPIVCRNRSGPVVGFGAPAQPALFLTESGEFPDMALAAMYRLGDVVFDDPGHHAEPAYRRVLVRDGNEAGNLGVKEAFEKGMKWTGLERT
jgi:hypothetical protein